MPQKILGWGNYFHSDDFIQMVGETRKKQAFKVFIKNYLSYDGS